MTPTSCPKFTRQMCRWNGWYPPEAWEQYDGQVVEVRWEHDHWDLTDPTNHLGWKSARATIEVVPVVNRLAQPDQECIQVFGNYVIYYHFGTLPWPHLPTGYTFNLDPLPRVGRDFAVVVRKVAA